MTDIGLLSGRALEKAMLKRARPNMSACVLKVTKSYLSCMINRYAAASSVNEGDQTGSFALWSR